jgi:hypothetical protein
MAITITGPDGATVDFPDGTGEGEINAAMAQAYPAPPVANPFNRIQTPGQPDTSIGAPLGGPTPGAGFGQGLLEGGQMGLQGLSLGAYQAPPGVAADTGIPGRITEMAGGMVPFALSEGALGAAGMAPGVGRTMLSGAATGAGEAAGTDYGTGQPQSPSDIALGAGLGAGSGLLAHALAGGVGRALSQVPDVPAAAELPGLTAGAYKAAEGLGATYDPGTFGAAVKDIAAKASDANYGADLPPFVARGISQLSNLAAKDEPVSLMTLDTVRKGIAGDIRSSADPAEARLGRIVTGGIDDLIATNPAAQDAITAARQQAQIGFKDTDLARALMNARMRTAATGGPGYESRLRGGLEKLREGQTAWSPDEAAQLSSAITGGPGQNALRQVGRFAGGVLPVGIELGSSLLLGQPGIGGGLAAAGLAGRAASAMMARNATNALRQTVRAGGVTPTRITPNTDAYRNMLAAALASYAGGGQR